ncbi:hypothetical protein CDL15_Pgr025818 [Punica granatum]|uniref:Uncharacterized protein n=1 Tax=Punica granatum TaxID=22663 RepID=A0A218WBU6_PUNGR|nr:hypothetical protein CDL15_Pgr025818 [Punica granatum]
MDAAFDAMGAMGFEMDVEYTVEGWAFIEEYSYKVLIDKLLEEQEQPELVQGGEVIAQLSSKPSTVPALPSCSSGFDTLDKASKPTEAPEKDSQGGRVIAQLSSGPSTSLALPSRSNAFDTLDKASKSIEAPEKDSQGERVTAQLFSGPSTAPALPSCSNVVNTFDKVSKLIEARKKDSSIRMSQCSNSSLPNHDIGGIPGTEAADSRNGEGGGHKGSPSKTRSSAPPLSTHAHGPFYGWFSEDEDQEHEPEIVELEPMSLEVFKKIYYDVMESHQLHRKRKSRWDVRPNS